MKYRANLLEHLKPLSYFDKATVMSLSKSSQMAETTVTTYISRYLKHNDIIKLKKGVYVTTDFYDKNKGDISYRFYLANVLHQPSYISSWTALQYYDLVTEIINTTISTTKQKTAVYDTKIGSFQYHSIKTELFSDFLLQKRKFDFFIATPSKALFDLLYFKTKQLRGVRVDMVDELVRELRIDIENMEKSERDLFYKKIKKYLS